MDHRARDLALAAVWFAVDAVTKRLAEALLVRPVTVIPGLVDLTVGRNRGALFGVLHDLDERARVVLLILVPSLALGLIVRLLWRLPRAQRGARLGLALVTAGAAGNLADRITTGSVVDFLDVHVGWDPVEGWLVALFGTARWPTFNLADVGLTAGSALLVGHWVARARRSRPTEPAPERAPRPD